MNKLIPFFSLLFISANAMGSSVAFKQSSYKSLCPIIMPLNDKSANALGFTVMKDGNPPLVGHIERGGAKFSNVRLSDGPPEEQAWLVPINPDENPQRWSLNSLTEQPYLSCGYSGQSTILVKQLSDRYHMCQASISKLGQHTKVICF